MTKFIPTRYSASSIDDSAVTPTRSNRDYRFKESMPPHQPVAGVVSPDYYDYHKRDTHLSGYSAPSRTRYAVAPSSSVHDSPSMSPTPPHSLPAMTTTNYSTSWSNYIQYGHEQRSQAPMSREINNNRSSSRSSYGYRHHHHDYQTQYSFHYDQRDCGPPPPPPMAPTHPPHSYADGEHHGYPSYRYSQQYDDHHLHHQQYQHHNQDHHQDRDQSQEHHLLVNHDSINASVDNVLCAHNGENTNGALEEKPDAPAYSFDKQEYEQHKFAAFTSQAQPSCSSPCASPTTTPAPVMLTPTQSWSDENNDGNSENINVLSNHKNEVPAKDSNGLRSADIVCGRGAPTNFHAGNEWFRDLIRQHQTQYLCAKRSDKPVIATKLLDLLKAEDRRFVRRVKSKGRFRWEEIDEKRAFERVCQSLRDGAPELRRQLLASKKVKAAAVAIKESKRQQENYSPLPFW